MKRLCLSAALASVLLANAASIAADAEPPASRTRRWFAAALENLSIGVSTREVERILGKPDDIITQFDAGGIITRYTREIWCYGSSGHMTYPLLGCIYIDIDGKAQHFYGPRDLDLDETLGKAEVAKLLQSLADVPGDNNPRLVLRAINLLQPLGKATGCRVLREFMQLLPRDERWWHTPNDEEYGLFLVARGLFDVPPTDNHPVTVKDPRIVYPGFLRAPLLGPPTFNPPADPRIMPQFPLLLIDDLPFDVSGDYMLAGKTETLESHLEALERDGTWRTKLLAPTGDPLEVLARIEKIGGLQDRQLLGLKRTVKLQILRLMDTVFRSRDADLDRQLAALHKVQFAWDAPTCRYTFKDGTVLPPVPRKFVRRQLFEPTLYKATMTAILERLDDSRVQLSLPYTYVDNRSPDHPSDMKAVTVRIYAVKDQKPDGDPLVDDYPRAYKDIIGWFNLPAGAEVQIAVEQDGKVQNSPVLKP